MLLLLLLLVASALGAESEGRDFVRELKGCQNKACLKTVRAAFKHDFDARIYAIVAEEHVLNELEFSSKVSKCEKMPDAAAKDLCLHSAREAEIRRKFSLLRRVEYKRFNILKKKCKDLRIKRARKICSKSVKSDLAKHISAQYAKMIDTLRGYSVADVKAEADYASLIPLAQNCTTATCQEQLAEDRCPADPTARRVCKRTVISVPFSSGVGK